MAVEAHSCWNVARKPCTYLLNVNRNKRSRWGDDSQEMLELMLGQVRIQQQSQTLDLLGGLSPARKFLELHEESTLPSGWEKCLDMKTGSVYFVNRRTGTRTSCDPRMLSIADLNSPPPGHLDCDESGATFYLPLSEKSVEYVEKGATRQHFGDVHSLDLGLCLAKSSESPKILSSCSSPPLSSSLPPSILGFHVTDDHCDTSDRSIITSNHVEAENDVSPPLVTLGCGKCLMYVMLSTADPRCPRCGTASLLDFPQLKKSKLTNTFSREM